jgi:hypothetical protein
MASGKGNTQAQKLLDLVYQAAAWANLADNAASSPITNIYAALSTGTLSATSTGTSTEAAYTSYARVAVVRSSSGWHRTNQTESNVAAITFPAATGGSETETYAQTNTASSGVGTLLHFGALTSSLAVSSGITPQFAIDAFAVTES